MHYESKSRGYEASYEKQERFKKEQEYMKKKWGHTLDRDKYFSILRDAYTKSLSYIDSISEAEEYWDNYKVLFTDFKKF